MNGAETGFDLRGGLAFGNEHCDKGLMAGEALFSLQRAMANGLKGEIQVGHLCVYSDQQSANHA